ncbi:unnamed protein product [Gongylonema pulchrum]|uniref:Uncharacterized protein n=1 Tax=Gongylonema pulchrum TaxID=637853 RepID=A0A183EIE7_9BILA|nr:unnamed protein product [Gongylonema pulchrum]
MSKRQLDETEIGASLPADGGDIGTSGCKKSKSKRTVAFRFPARRSCLL